MTKTDEFNLNIVFIFLFMTTLFFVGYYVGELGEKGVGIRTYYYREINRTNEKYFECVRSYNDLMNTNEELIEQLYQLRKEVMK